MARRSISGSCRSPLRWADGGAWRSRLPGGGGVVLEAEAGDKACELVGFVGQAARGCGAFFHHRRILSRHLLHFANRAVDML